MKARAIIVVALALLTAAIVMLAAFIAGHASRGPGKAAAVWSGHPSVIFAEGLDEVGQTAAAGRPVSTATVDRLLAASSKDPLAPEPFLVRGVQARVSGNQRLAERAFLEARRRDPRSVAAHYFLADHYLKTGQIRRGLGEISTLARLVPQSLDGIAPYLAAYARSPGGAPEVKAMLRSHPELEPLLLNVLAADANNERLALSLWSGRGDENARRWQERMLNSLVATGQYDRARAAWTRFNPAAPRRGELVDPDFTAQALAPFGWTLASGPSGVAEPEAGGRLHILYYGRDNVVLASQLLVLRPGSYRLSMRLSGVSPSAKSLAWTVRCLPASNQIAAIELAGATKGGALTATLVVPSSGCTAQLLELAGTAPEFPEQSDVTIAGLRLEREAVR
jgi:hypothetical protein